MSDAQTPRRFNTPREKQYTPTPATGPRHKLHELIPACGGVLERPASDVVPLGRPEKT